MADKEINEGNGENNIGDVSCTICGGKRAGIDPNDARWSEANQNEAEPGRRKLNLHGTERQVKET